MSTFMVNMGSSRGWLSGVVIRCRVGAIAAFVVDGDCIQENGSSSGITCSIIATCCIGCRQVFRALQRHWNESTAMHPPLDRPHPDCQDVIQALRDCHSTKPFWKIWACNDIKFALDRCFKAEKLRRWAKDQEEAHALHQAMDTALQGESFADFLQRDKAYQKDMAEIKKAKKAKEEKK